MTDAATQLALISQTREVRSRARRFVRGYTFRRIEPSGESALASLYFAAYRPDVVSSQRDADEEIARTFAGEYGPLNLEASPIVLRGRDVVAAAMVVDRAPWTETPPGPFIIEVMVDPGHRRQGLAECALRWSADRLASSGVGTMALFVMSANASARSLYAKLGFTSWVGG